MNHDLVRHSLITRAARPIAAAWLAVPAFAHTTADPAHNAADGLLSGLLHPLSGADHLLAMLAVGLWAAQLGRRALWALPATFVGVMLLGAGMGLAGAPLPFIESGILASVLVLGVLIAAAVRAPLPAALVCVSIFALFHGHAHGAELPGGASALAYVAGFSIATLALHGLGLALAFGLMRLSARSTVRFAGAAVALGGVLLWFA